MQYSPSPTAAPVSANQYLTQKYGIFQSATIPYQYSTIQTVLPELEGKEHLTLNDLKTVKLAIDNQITRLETIRSFSATYQKKQSDLEEISFRLSNVISAIQRGDASISDYPIQVDTAKYFLEKFRQLDVVPPLFEVVAAAPTEVKQEESLYNLVQRLKMELSQRETESDDSNYMIRLSALEKRLLSNSLLGNPIPNDLRNDFLQILKQVYTNLIV
jgi:hypothetical protein